MLNRFMITAATAALIAGTSFAYAQQGPSKEGPSGGAGMQQSAPSSGGAEHGTKSSQGAPSGGAEHGMKSSQGGEKMQPQGAQNQRAQDTKSGAKEERSEKSAQETKGSKGTQAEERSKSTQNEKGAAGKDMKAEGREGKDMKAEGREGRDGMKAEGREDRSGMKAEGREGRDGKNAAEGGRMENRTTTTTGQAGAGARLSTEQRTRISTVIRDQHVSPVNNVNFAVSVGTRVPREIGFHPLPQEIVTIYPDWRGYEFFLTGNEIVVVDPRTLEIVAVLPA